MWCCFFNEHAGRLLIKMSPLILAYQVLWKMHPHHNVIKGFQNSWPPTLYCSSEYKLKFPGGQRPCVIDHYNLASQWLITEWGKPTVP